MTKKIAVVIPVYNEQKTIRYTVDTIRDYLVENGYEYKIVIVNDGSTDRTQREILKLLKKYDNVHSLENFENKGKGHAVREGAMWTIHRCTGYGILYIDADLSAPIETLEQVDFNKEETIFIADREHEDSKIKPQPWLRRKAGKLFENIRESILNLGLKDSQCGFKYFPPKTVRIFTSQTLHGFAFDCELLHIAKESGFEIQPIPVEWTDDEDTKVNPILDGVKMFAGLLKIRINDILGNYR